VLDCAVVDGEVDAQQIGHLQQALLLAAHDGATRSGRHEQRLDAEWIARAEQLLLDRVPQREGEHAAQPRQRVGAPVVVCGQDGLAVAVGGEDCAVLGGESFP
jgi:hypothetical protein